MKVLEDHENLVDFIKRVEQVKYLIASFTRDLAPGRTLYILYGRESYLSRPAYVERSCNSQSFQQYDDKVHDVRFPSRVHRKDIDDKSKSINRIG